jgi:hypothetical protein
MLNNEGIIEFMDNKEKEPKKEQVNEIKPVHVSINHDPMNELKDKLIIKTRDEVFNIYNYRNNLLGSFSIKQIIKYLIINSGINTNFMINVDIKEENDLINRLIGYVKQNIKDNNSEIVIRSYMDSPLMGNIEILINLNNLLYKYEKHQLDNDLLQVEQLTDRTKIKNIIKRFIYMLLQHTLKIICLISDQIKGDSSKKDLALNLMKQSMNINYRISLYIKHFLENNIENINNLNENFNKLKHIRRTLINKLDNIKIGKEQYGGNYSSTNEYTSQIPTNSHNSNSENSLNQLSDSSIIYKSSENSENNFQSEDSSSVHSAYDSLTSKK